MGRGRVTVTEPPIALSFAVFMISKLLGLMLHESITAAESKAR
jgi:hypothetical protein